jgi:hypothetical protein
VRRRRSSKTSSGEASLILTTNTKTYRWQNDDLQMISTCSLVVFEVWVTLYTVIHALVSPAFAAPPHVPP